MKITTHAVGGCTFNVYVDDKYIGSVEAGEIDADGQWVGDESDVESAILNRWEWGLPDNSTFYHKW